MLAQSYYETRRAMHGYVYHGLEFVRMTTIVFDGKTLACDGQVTVEERSAATQYRKIHTPPEGTMWKLLGEDVKAIGLAGDVAALQSVRQELTLERFGGIERGGVRFETTYPEQIEFIVLAVLTDGRVIDASKCKDNKYASYVFVEPPYAIGSGAHYALGALGAGVDAPTAVEVAKRYDLYSGGQTQTLKLF
ncbi:hypothetical protein ACYB2G_003780 [Salmonella enterica subsp. enterica serovar Chester]